MSEAFAKIPGGDAGHAKTRHGLDFMEAESEEFGVGDGINVGIVGARAVPTHEEGNGFVEIVNNDGMPFVEHAVNGFSGLLGLLMGVAVDIHVNVFAPIRGSLPRKSAKLSFAFEVAVEPFDLFVAAI